MFLKFINFYRKFIIYYFKITAPIFNLSKEKNRK